MTIDEAKAFVRANWGKSDGCGSCGWRSALYEHEPLHIEQSDIDQGFVRFPCFSEAASENGGHRGIRIYFTSTESK